MSDLLILLSFHLSFLLLMNVLIVVGIDFDTGSSLGRNSAVLAHRYHISRHTVLVQVLTIHSVTFVILIDYETSSLLGDNVVVLYDRCTLSGPSYVLVEVLSRYVEIDVNNDVEMWSLRVGEGANLANPMKVVADKI